MYVINEDIKNKNFKHVYLLTGEEDYLINQFKEKLIYAFTGKKILKELQGDMNFSCFDGKNTDIPKVIDFSETQPFFAERRIILLQNIEFDSKETEILVQYLSEIPEYSYFIIVERSLNKNSVLYKGCEKYGHVADFKEQSEERIRQWLIGLVKKEGKNITNGALNEILTRAGFDMSRLSKEMDKLLLYCMDKEAVEREDVEKLVFPTVSDHIYQMIEAIGNKNRQRALDLYYELLGLRESPMRILNLLEKQFANLYAAKELRQKGFEKRMIAEKLDKKSFIVDKFLGQASKFTLDQLRGAIQDCAQYDELIKRGDMKDQMGVEMLLIKYSS